MVIFRELKACKASIQQSRREKTKSIHEVVIIIKNGALCARHCMNLEQQAALFLKSLLPKWMIHTQGNRRLRTNKLQEGW